MLDWEGRQENTRYEGLFSIEPWKSNKHRFNFWTVPVGNKINHSVDPRKPSEGHKPSQADAARFKIQCPQADYTIILSSSTFRSYCPKGPNSPPCAVSMNSPFMGRLFAHEFGHGFGKLGDEYYNLVQPTSNSQAIGGADASMRTGPNCKATQTAAEAAWSNLVSEDIGYFPSCGGDCGAECANFVRPTENSVMNHQNMRANAQNCDTPFERASLRCQGPPFSPWYDVNARAIELEMANYNPDFEGTEPPVVIECTDLDGYAFFNASSATGPLLNGTITTLNDYCEENTIHEARCYYDWDIQKRILSYYSFDCATGCADGACIIPEDDSCTETDGGLNIGVRGNASGLNWEYIRENRTDYCYSDNLLLEYHCEDLYEYTGPKVMGQRYARCELGCIDGACIMDVRNIEELDLVITRDTSVNVTMVMGGQNYTHTNVYFDDKKYQMYLERRPGSYWNAGLDFYGREDFEEITLQLGNTTFPDGTIIEIVDIRGTGLPELTRIVYPDDMLLADAQQDCTDRTGTFNECGSTTCPPGSICPAVCIMMCEFD